MNCPYCNSTLDEEYNTAGTLKGFYHCVSCVCHLFYDKYNVLNSYTVFYHEANQNYVAYFFPIDNHFMVCYYKNSHFYNLHDQTTSPLTPIEAYYLLQKIVKNKAFL